jgi:hypothetical protein
MVSKVSEERKRLRERWAARNPGVKFPHKCTKCGNLTKKVTSGKWKGTYHCNECDSYQEWLRSDVFSIPKKRK